jgi:beta-xylosidase
VTTDGGAQFAVDITNTGRRPGSEIVQLYISQAGVGVTRPAQELVGFARVELPPTETATVRFTVSVAQLTYLGPRGDLVVEPGRRTALVGASSDDIRARVEFDIGGTPITLTHRTHFFASTEVTTQRQRAADRHR